MEKEICICAALKTASGVIIRGHRHGDCIQTAARMKKLTRHDVMDSEQGFITSKNRFVSRIVGRKLQDAAVIPSADKEGYRGKTLFSEDLY